MGVLTKVRSNFWEPLGFNIVKLLLINQISKHSHAFNGGQTKFDQEDRIGSSSLDLEVIGYELLWIISIFLHNSLDILHPQTSHSYKITVVTRVSKRNLFLLQMYRSTDLQLFSSS